MKTLITVDVVAQGRAFIASVKPHSNEWRVVQTVVRDGRRFRIEDSESGDLIGYGATYTGCAKLAANEAGFFDHEYTIEIDREF